MTPVTNDIVAAVKDNLSNAKDNLYRAQMAARRSDPSKQYGESGETLQQIIDGYQSSVDRWEKALMEFARLREDCFREAEQACKDICDEFGHDDDLSPAAVAGLCAGRIRSLIW